MRFVIIFCLAVVSSSLSAQNEGGHFSLGMRSTVSLFGDNGTSGIGTGGQFRIRIHKNINTDWFTDYITTDIEGLGRRHDYHIGWSVLFYPTKNPLQEKKLTPYFIAGHCFDYTEVATNGSVNKIGIIKVSRWSSAVQGGLGVHYNLTKNFDISLMSQYMLHLGKVIDAHVYTDAFGNKGLQIEQHSHGLEGHLLTTLSLNYKIADLWNREK